MRLHGNSMAAAARAAGSIIIVKAWCGSSSWWCWRLVSVTWLSLLLARWGHCWGPTDGGPVIGSSLRLGDCQVVCCMIFDLLL